MVTRRERALIAAIVLLWTCLACSSAATPLIGWSNSEVFASTVSNEEIDIVSLVGGIADELRQLDFVVVFGAQQLSFDDIAKFAGLYGDSSRLPLASLQAAVMSSKSSLWGGTEMASLLTNEISIATWTTIHHLSDLHHVVELFQPSSSVQLFFLELSSAGTPEQIFSQHGSVVEEVMKVMDSLNANFAAFYTASQGEKMSYMARQTEVEREKERERRAAEGETEAEKGSNSTSQGVCSSTVVIAERNETTGEIKEACGLLCVRSSLFTPPGEKENGGGGEEGGGGEDVLVVELNAVFWESWRAMSNESTKEEPYYLTTFEFDEESANCSGSSLQEEFLDEFNMSSISIKANLIGTRNFSDSNDIISLEVEFVFFQGSNDKVYLLPGLQGEQPGKQVLQPGFWTMQLLVTLDEEVHYLTRFRTDLELGPENTTDLTEARGLFYPFAIPVGISYSCLTYIDHLTTSHGNLNRFVPTRFPVNSSEPVENGPVLQFVGLQVQAYGEVYSLPLASGESKQMVFDTAYDCQGYFDISTLMGTFAVLIITVMLYFAVLCSFSLQTVDRFDDPRGQTISVENLH